MAGVGGFDEIGKLAAMAGFKVRELSLPLNPLLLLVTITTPLVVLGTTMEMVVEVWEFTVAACPFTVTVGIAIPNPVPLIVMVSPTQVGSAE